MNLKEECLSSHGTSPSEARENFTENMVFEKSFKERTEVCQVKQRNEREGKYRQQKDLSWARYMRAKELRSCK